MNDPPKPTYCWDTSVFLAWINEETGAPLTDIESVAIEIDKNQANLLVPVTIASEILRSRLSAEQRNKLTLFLKRENVIQAAITLDIAEKAGEIRDAAHAMKPRRSIKTPDAQIIAAAIIYGCAALHSLDDRIIKLNGTTTVGGLRICRPCLAGAQIDLEEGAS